MIQTEYYRTREDGILLYRTYSDDELMIRKDGTHEIYSEAIDFGASGNTYSETEIPIIAPDESESDLTVEDALGMLRDLGVDVDDEE